MRNLFVLFTLLLSITFNSCSEDDGTRIENIANEFDGVYKGKLNVNVDNEPLASEVIQKIYISKSGDNQFKLELKNFSIEGMEIGNIVVSNIDVKKKSNSCTFVGDEIINLTVGNCNVNVEGKIQDKETDIDISVELVDEGAPEMEILVDFEGSKLDSDQSSEALISDFTFDMSNEANAIVTSTPVIDGDNITFNVIDTASPEQIDALEPTVAISSKATMTKSGSFNETLVYTITSEDEIVNKQYNVTIDARTNTLSYSFDIWEKKEMFFEFEIPTPTTELETSNQGVAFLSLYGFTDQDGDRVNVVRSEDAVKGSSSKIVTFDSRTLANELVPGITPGALYIGKFNLGQAMVDRLKTTEFGMAFDKKEPLMFNGWYKYSPGEVFYNAEDPTNIVVVDGKEDECTITAVLFEIENDADILTGVDINTSEKRIAVANLEDKTAKAEWTRFEIPFTLLEGKSYDPSKKYKITFTCSSSKEGDLFKGAPRSTLFVDEFEITYKSHK